MTSTDATLFGKPKKPAATSAGRPPADCVILDPQIGRPIPLAQSQPPAAALPTPPPRPMTPKEHALFDPLLQGLIAPIVTTKMTRNHARAYANNAPSK